MYYHTNKKIYKKKIKIIFEQVTSSIGHYFVWDVKQDYY